MLQPTRQMRYPSLAQSRIRPDEFWRKSNTLIGYTLTQRTPYLRYVATFVQPRNHLANIHEPRPHIISLTANNNNRRTVINPKARRVLRMLSPVSPNTFDIQEFRRGFKRRQMIRGRSTTTIKNGRVGSGSRLGPDAIDNTTRDGSPKQLDVANSARSSPDSGVSTQTRSHLYSSSSRTQRKESWLIVSDLNA